MGQITERQKQIKEEAQKLFNSRFSMAMGDGAGAPDATSLRLVNLEFKKLADELGISEAGLEFWLNPVGIVGEISQYSITHQNLSRGEQVIESVNVRLAQEIKNAGLV